MKRRSQMMMRRKVLITIFIVITGLLSWFYFTSESASLPKPKGYFRIDLPQKNYGEYTSRCPISFELPKYSEVELFRDKMSNDSCWFNIHFPKFNARLHCTYLPVGSNLGSLLQDSYGFAAKHEMKASALKRTMISNPERKVYGIIYDIEGDAASQLQFFLTDSTEHFFRGSLYFFSHPNPDSIAPVLSFIREDVIHLAQTISWK